MTAVILHFSNFVIQVNQLARSFIVCRCIENNSLITASSIAITKKDGAVSANIGTLDVNANTAITVDGTAATDAPAVL